MSLGRTSQIQSSTRSNMSWKSSVQISHRLWWRRCASGSGWCMPLLRVSGLHSLHLHLQLHPLPLQSKCRALGACLMPLHSIACTACCTAAACPRDASYGTRGCLGHRLPQRLCAVHPELQPDPAAVWGCHPAGGWPQEEPCRCAQAAGSTVETPTPAGVLLGSAACSGFYNVQFFMQRFVHGNKATLGFLAAFEVFKAPVFSSM